MSCHVMCICVCVFYGYFGIYGYNYIGGVYLFISLSIYLSIYTYGWMNYNSMRGQIVYLSLSLYVYKSHRTSVVYGFHGSACARNPTTVGKEGIKQG